MPGSGSHRMCVADRNARAVPCTVLNIVRTALAQFPCWNGIYPLRTHFVRHDGVRRGAPECQNRRYACGALAARGISGATRARRWKMRDRHARGLVKFSARSCAVRVRPIRFVRRLRDDSVSVRAARTRTSRAAAVRELTREEVSRAVISCAEPPGLLD